MRRPRVLPTGRRFARRPSVHLSAAVALALVTGLLCYRSLHAANEAADMYGQPIDVVVALVPITPGDQLTDDRVARRRLPAAAVPASSVTDVVIGRTSHRFISAGEVIVTADVAPAGSSAAAAALPPGTVAIALATGDHPLEVHRGDHVDLLASTTEADFGFIAQDALVVSVGAERLTVAVRSETAPAVAAATLAGTVVPVVRAADS